MIIKYIYIYINTSRFYFRHTLLKSYEFKFPFCIPNSTNSWESIYDMPIYSEK